LPRDNQLLKYIDAPRLKSYRNHININAPCLRSFMNYTPCLRIFMSYTPCLKSYRNHININAPCLRSFMNYAPCLRIFTNCILIEDLQTLDLFSNINLQNNQSKKDSHYIITVC
jgi:hypothetical protein